MTCRIRAGEVARPRAAASPQGPPGSLRRPVVLGPPLLPMHICRPVIREAAGLGVRPGPPRRCGGGLSSEGIFTHRRRKIRAESAVCGVTHHSPVRVDTPPFERVSSRPTTPVPATEGFKYASALRALRNFCALLEGRVSTPSGGTPSGPFETRAGRSDGSVRAVARVGVRQLSEPGGRVTRAARRSPSRTRRACARVGACTSLSPR